MGHIKFSLRRYNPTIISKVFLLPLFREVALEFLNKSIKMVRKLVEILIGKLGVTVEDSRIDAFIGSKMFNMNFYPACPNPELTVGVGRHSDMGTLTVLLQDGIGGLYVKVEEDIDAGKKGDWIEIPPIPGALVINVGDTLQVHFPKFKLLTKVAFGMAFCVLLFLFLFFLFATFFDFLSLYSAHQYPVEQVFKNFSDLLSRFLIKMNQIILFIYLKIILL